MDVWFGTTVTAADIQKYIYNATTAVMADFAAADMNHILIYRNWEAEYIKVVKLVIKNHQVSG
jgi:hypothetical protein